jgi:hypothetical protein
MHIIGVSKERRTSPFTYKRRRASEHAHLWFGQIGDAPALVKKSETRTPYRASQFIALDLKFLYNTILFHYEYDW